MPERKAIYLLDLEPDFLFDERERRAQRMKIFGVLRENRFPEGSAKVVGDEMHFFVELPSLVRARIEQIAFDAFLEKVA